MVEDVALAFALQIEIGVVGQVDHGGGGGPGTEAEVELVLVVEGITRFGDQLPRIARLAVGAEVGEHHALAFDAAGPFLVGEADASAVEVMLAVAGVQVELVFRLVDLEPAACNAVGKPSGHLAGTRAVAIV